jgi:hypothetical protein
MKSNPLQKWTGALLLALPLAVHAQYSIDWFTIDSGGGTSTGGDYSLSGTIGQPEAGMSITGGEFAMTGGFWPGVQVAGAPLLTIYLKSGNRAVVSWPSPSSGFTLQQNAGLNAADWVTPSEAVTDDGTNKFIVVSPPLGHRFYRLFKP